LQIYAPINLNKYKLTIMANKLWTREELIVALNLYLKLPFGKLHSRTPEIIHLAHILDRTPSSIAMRLNNFASVDPYHQQRGIGGLPGGRKQVEPIWNEFNNNREELLFESERILAEKENVTIEDKYSKLLTGIENLKGEIKIREVKTRINQNVFRQIVMANYSGRCAITGIGILELLVASHIIPWAKNERERLNPRNGIAINGLHDKAFEEGYITITPDFKIKISSFLKKQTKVQEIQDYFLRYDNKSIFLPARFLPDKEFLIYHNDVRFKG
jgi:putative restriction endonuclease